MEIVRDLCTSSDGRIASARDELLAAFRVLAERSGINMEPFDSVDPTQIPLGLLADTIAYTANLDLNCLLTVLSKIDVVERSVAVTGMIREKYIEIEVSPMGTGLSGFPPGFSDN